MIRHLRPQDDLDFLLQQILRLGVYELIELGLPDHVINDHVDLARKLVRPEAAKLVNGEPLQHPHSQCPQRAKIQACPSQRLQEAKMWACQTI